MLKEVDYLVVGNGIAGGTAAETIRAEDSAGSIAIISEEKHPLYSRVLLPNYVKGLIPREKVFLRKLEDYRAKNIDFLSGASAVHLDLVEHSLHVKTGEGFRFRKLLLAPGGRPRALAGAIEVPGTTRFQTVDDADGIVDLVPGAKHALVVGGGFIALEYLDVLSRAHVPTTLLFSGAHFFENFLDLQGSFLFEENFRVHGVGTIIADDGLKAVEGRERVERARTTKERTIDCDFVGIGIGIEKNVEWLKTSGLQLSKGGIVANEFLETATSGVFAAGDVADFFDVVTGTRHSHGNWANAFLQGKTAGWNMVHPGSQQVFRNVPYYSIINLGFGITFVGRTSVGTGIETVVHYTPGEKRYARFFLEGERLAGAILVNRPADRLSVTKLIEQGIRLDGWRQKLADPGFPLGSFLPAQ